MAERDRPEEPRLPEDPQVDVVETILAEPVMEPSAPPEPPLPPPPPGVTARRSSGGFLPALAGGALAAVVGFGLSHFDVLGLGAGSPDLAGLQERLAATEEGLTEANAALADLRTTPAPADPAMQDRLAALESAVTEPQSDPRIDGLLERMDTLQTQLANASTSGSGVSGAALAALQAEVQTLKSATPARSEDMAALVDATEARLAEAEGRAEALMTEAQAIANGAKMTAALGQLRAALDSGQAYTASMAMLEGAELPVALTEHAATGLPTVASLQAGFPVAARTALEAALRANPGESWTERAGSFLRGQTGARSLTPREGSDPDAILSRAEAAVASGDLDAALQEIDALPPAAKDAMTDWTALVERRRAAVSAIEALSAKTSG